MDRLVALGQISDESGRLTRLYLSPAHKAAVGELSQWMRDAGLAVSVDALATVVGRYEASQAGAPALLIGSHIDTIRDAGRYDGALGVLAGLAALEELSARGERFPFAIELIAFGDEEGVRFPTTLNGSRAIAGGFDSTSLDGLDSDGITLRQALADFGCDPAAIKTIARSPRDTLAYVEVHIEQGPVLEAEGLPVGVVTAINGVKRFSIEIRGEAGHAGTVPMDLRRDALTGSAEMIVAIESIAKASDVVATVGRAEISPGAVNVIPGAVTFTLDVRSPYDAIRDKVVDGISAAITAIAARRKLTARMTLTHQAPATPCSPSIIEGLSTAIKRQGVSPKSLPSGAGHDAMAIAPLCPIGMLFVRCAGGISHNPLESITTDDADMCVRVLLDFLRHHEARR
jgi:hydantoinase/carbamoylase family amidase